jgi:hypothetical protein
MEQAASLSCSHIKMLKSSEQSSVDYSLPATNVYLISASSIASVSYGLLLVLPTDTVSVGICAAPALRGALAERIFFHAIFS